MVGRECRDVVDEPEPKPEKCPPNAPPLLLPKLLPPQCRLYEVVVEDEKEEDNSDDIQDEEAVVHVAASESPSGRTGVARDRRMERRGCHGSWAEGDDGGENEGGAVDVVVEKGYERLRLEPLVLNTEDGEMSSSSSSEVEEEALAKMGRKMDPPPPLLLVPPPQPRLRRGNGSKFASLR